MGPKQHIQDFEEYAAKYLPKQAYDYYSSGADEEVTLKRNMSAFRRYYIRPRVLRDVSVRDLSTTVLGAKFKMSFPVGIASTASQKLANYKGECATAKAAASCGTIMIVSTIATTSLEEVAKAGGPEALCWFQLYIYKDRKITAGLVKRAENAGYKALVLTVDTPVSGKRRNDIRNGYSLPPPLKMANFAENDVNFQKVGAAGASGFQAYVNSLFDAALNWDDLRWLSSITKLPVLVKGVLTGEDAEIAVKNGVAGIIVSNHGARQLDHVHASIEALPEVVAAVAGRCEVFLDGGVRTGNDVFKALALGAKAVFIGRPVLWGLAYEGEKGVAKVLDTLKEEFDITMALAGCRNVGEISKAHIAPYSSSSKL